MSCGAWILIYLMACDEPAGRVGTLSPDQQYRKLAQDHQSAFQAFQKASEEAKTDEELKAVENHPGRNPRSFAPGFMALADKYPESTAAEDSLIWVCSHTFRTLECEEAKRRLVRDHVRSEKLGPALGYQGHYSDYFEGTEAFLRSVAADSPHHEIQGQAYYWLARHLLHKAAGVRATRQNLDFEFVQGVDPHKDVYGADWAERLRRLDPEALEREAETLFERVAKYYGDVPHNDKRREPGPLGEVALSYLRERRDLAIGKPAPDTVGTDLDGRPFRLADYQGRVVVLDFGSHFYCGLCREAYPQMRALTERHRGRPFAVISINAEPEKSVEELKKAWADEGNTWRCLLDGTWEGPIQKAWNIQSFPTIYVLDGKGMIRHKTKRGRELDDAVGALLNELTGK